ncbi:TPA: hypothetical protein ACSP71_003887, partial [Aeromonas hydrophila]
PLALESIRNAYSEGMGFDEFCIKNTFALLINEEYEQVISFIEMNIDGMSSLTDKDILVINRELANKKLSKPVNEMAVNNVIGHKFNDLAVLCAHCILSDTKAHEVKATALLKKYYENNYRNILMFKHWPAIPKSMIQKITYENAANKTESDSQEYVNKA